jgi:hypothetical protein
MGRTGESPLVKPVVGILAASVELIEDACSAIAEILGEVEERTDAEPWAVSDYYGAEMGTEIWRCYASLGELAPADRLAAWKLESNRLEERWTAGGKRRVNVDPGYVDLLRLVLASTKDAGHRIYLGGGIFAEVTLRYENGAFRPWPQTYPDYAAPRAVEFFTRVRARCAAQLRERRWPAPRGG